MCTFSFADDENDVNSYCCIICCARLVHGYSRALVILENHPFAPAERPSRLVPKEKITAVPRLHPGLNSRREKIHRSGEI